MKSWKTCQSPRLPSDEQLERLFLGEKKSKGKGPGAGKSSWVYSQRPQNLGRETKAKKSTGRQDPECASPYIRPRETQGTAGLKFPGGAVVKNPPADAGDVGLIPGFDLPGSGRSRRGGNGNPLQYSCLENPREEEPGGL